MSVSALQRHLSLEGKSFQMLKDELRRDMAIVRLTSTGATLSAIADELGFADSTAFQRAFKSWTGSTPGIYRSPLRRT
jgi:AraC-like DNA-binding protein